MITRWAILVAIIASGVRADEARGKRLFGERCGSCHGAEGGGGERGPAVAARLPLRDDAQLADLIRKGLPGAGMPATALDAGELRDMLEWLRTLRAPGPEEETLTVTLQDGRTLAGIVRNRGQDDLQLLAADGRIHLLRRAGRRWRRAGAPGDRDWPAYHGQPGGNRHSEAVQIHPANIQHLRVSWMYSAPGWQRLEMTPVVADGVMYVTSVNEVHALDAGTGRPIWRYRRPRTAGLVGDASSGINRGVALSGDRVFLVTDNAHLLALNRWTGALLWDVMMADSRANYGATGAPLVAGDLVLSGISGGDEGVRGFLSAYRVTDGERVWRFWTVPAPGEPGADTWQGSAWPHGCASTWMTGTFDSALDLLFWSTGNPCPDYNGEERRGDNLYSDSVLALRPKTGTLVWHYQFTPHDLHDWDAQQTPMLVDAVFAGKPRKLLLQANRNGFWYVLDRATGELLLAKPFVKKLTWASEVGKDGRPVVIPEANPTPHGAKACPAVEGATNWFSTAFHPGLRLFFVQALEKCTIYSTRTQQWEAGKSYYGGTTRDVPGEPGRKVLRALDLDTAGITWEMPQEGPANSWGGVLTTASGLLFAAEDSGGFVARDARTGKPLWQFDTHQLWKASPMTYQFDGKQYIAIAAGSTLLAFGLP